MKKEYLFIFIAGLFLLAYVLEAIVNPLALNLATPYDYLNPAILTKYPFTTAIILIRAVAIFLTPLWLFSFFSGNHTLKGVVFLLVAGLAQLYAIQEIATGAQVIPLEWSLSLSLAGLALLLPAVLQLLLGLAKQTKQKLTPKKTLEVTNN
ncbi:MAG: hypothetical protein WAV56_04770 [Microgenomates group bacterium]